MRELQGIKQNHVELQGPSITVSEMKKKMAELIAE